jgi:hypothetical protein
MSRTIATRLMALVLRHAPGDRAEWAQAMAHEFEALPDGHLVWALGCLTTAAGWWLRANLVYAGSLIAAPIVVQDIWNRLFLTISGSGPAGADLFRAYGPTLAMLAPLPAAILLGWYRPRAVAATTWVAGLFVNQIALTTVSAWEMGVSPFTFWGPGATLYMAPPLVGLCASLGVWYFGGKAGARLAGARRPA